ncbi:MAG: tRNA (adenosine(37)-N6)-dimethylallyltransferase MiaA [Candidatus Latescibacteria bacterium]|nr:tRNA (adenosine(37)-N6)-dimethylallyltransferase MiaA [Candidatus Latescibacterota bacterium]
MSMKQRRFLVIVGPTGVGKTRVALEIAEKSGAQILSADSRQIYRYMDIGTAKPSREERRRVRHYFIDIINPDQRYSAGEYGQQARQQLRDLFRRGKLPIVVGGSGLYIRALLDGLSPELPSDPEIKNQLIEELKASGNIELHRRLREVDPQAAERIHPHDSQRILRALEVFQITGRKISEMQKILPQQKLEFTPVVVGLNMERKRLYQKIEQRVERMIAEGLVEEVEKLVRMGYSKDLNSLRTVGYKEVFPLLEGKQTLEKTVEEIKKNSRRYAKRQLTWFCSDPRVRWIDNFRGDSTALWKLFCNS